MEGEENDVQECESNLLQGKRPLASEDEDANTAKHPAPSIPHEKLRIIFRCKTCRLPFINRQRLHTHYRQVHNYVICHTCNATFVDRMYLQEHYNLTHKANKTYCVQCKLSCKTVEEFVTHCNTVHYNSNNGEEQNSELIDGDLDENTDTSLECKICNSKLPSVEELMSHYSEQHKAARYKRSVFKKCTLCSMLFVTAEALVAHCRKVHNTFAPTKHKCTTCMAEFGSYASLSSHQLRVHKYSPAVSANSYKCQICSEEFETIHILANHTKDVHSHSEELSNDNDANSK